MDQSTLNVILIYICFIFSISLSLIINKLIIIKEKKKHLGQVIRKDIVSTHLKKRGTPTMGGVSIYLTFLIFQLLNLKDYDNKIQIIIITSTLFFLLGLIDDYLKIKKSNSKGLSGNVRIISEIIIVILALKALGYDKDSSFYITVKDHYIYLGKAFIIFMIFIIVGSANAINMTDGLDGLASGLLVLAYLPFLIVSIKNHQFEYSLMITAIIGGNIGFLIFNSHPAKIFMGDCGSLFNGVMLSLIALMLDAIYLLPIAGFIFIVETLSVIIQVLSFKIFKKRVFKMAPLHHHFEVLGMKEFKVVNMFYLFGYICMFIALILGGTI